MRPVVFFLPGNYFIQIRESRQGYVLILSSTANTQKNGKDYPYPAKDSSQKQNYFSSVASEQSLNAPRIQTAATKVTDEK